MPTATKTLKYNNYLSVSFPPYMMDIINKHCWEKSISKQDFIRSCVRFVLNDNGSQDVDIKQITNNNEETTIKATIAAK